MNDIRVQMVTDCGMVLIVTVPSLYSAIKEAEEQGYKIVSAIQLGGV
jgi:hypothetical protein